MSQIRLIAVAAALAAAGSAQALTPAEIDALRGTTLKEIRVAGASALRLSVAAYMKEVCTDTVTGTSNLHVYFYSTSAQSTDHRAYACNLGVAVGNYAKGTPVLVYKRDAGGSGQGVNPIAAAALQTHMLVSGPSCTTVLNSNPSTDPAVANYLCAVTENLLSDAGISDAEPAIFQAAVNLPTGSSALTSTQLNQLNVAPLVQALFGVAVNKKAYRALQEAQGIIAPGGALLDVPADQNTWTTATLATIPSLPMNFIRGALTGQVIGGSPNTTAKKGWNIVIPTGTYSLDGGVTTRPAVDANAVTKTMNICRRTEGSGTQAVTAAFVAENPCNNSAGGLYTPAGVAGSSGNATTVVATVTNAAPNLVQEGTSAGQVEGCFSETETAVGGTDNIAYAIGVLGREANALRSGGDLGYRYVKIDGAAPVRNVAKAGGYPFVYEATMQWNTATVTDADKVSFLTALRGGFGSPNGLAAVDSDTQQGVMSPPSAYAGSYADATGNAALFGSRVSRATGNSCAALRMTK